MFSTKTLPASGMKYSELQNKDTQELNQTLNELEIKLGRLRFELANKTLKNFNQLKQTRKDIARIRTALQAGKPVS